jgi:ethanolamine ammonia-lyase small subunit
MGTDIKLVPFDTSVTSARILLPIHGVGYSTRAQLELRRDHAYARDAVLDELNPEQDFGQPFLEHYQIQLLQSQANSKLEYLLRPDLGRMLASTSREIVLQRGNQESDILLVIGDGLSIQAVRRQAPRLFAALYGACMEKGWRIGPSFLIRYCRVGILNEIGDLLQPKVALLLIGERPGLATAESLSVYLAYQPQSGHTDANRNLISNIHDQGVSIDAAIPRLIDLIHQMMSLRRSGIEVKERLNETSLSLEEADVATLG